MNVLRGAVLVGCVAYAACASTRSQTVDFSENPRSYRGADYGGVHDAWTRHAKLVQDIGTAMEIWATFKSWEFRQAYVAKYAKVYDLADSEREALAKSQLETARAVYEIHLVAQSTNDHWNDLGSRRSPWRLTLLDGTGAELAPTTIKVEKLPDAYESEFFPSRTPFSKTYTLRFVRPEGADASFVGPPSGRLILRLASPLGKVEVAWEAKEGVSVR
ncbi:MAG: hypothetical protein JXP73_00290 [Deltaproteobacteria bacterium]|nr:hypothetical protein [Deltaproteobacteria bacterium]